MRCLVMVILWMAGSVALELSFPHTNRYPVPLALLR